MIRKHFLQFHQKLLNSSYVTSNSAEDHEKFVRCKSNLRPLTRTLRKDFEKALANKIKHSTKPFWSYVQSKLKTKVKISTMTKLDGRKLTTLKKRWKH